MDSSGYQEVQGIPGETGEVFPETNCPTGVVGPKGSTGVCSGREYTATTITSKRQMNKIKKLNYLGTRK